MSESPSSPCDDPRFDFDGWALLAKSDPPAFEAKRKALIEQTIERAQPRQRVRLRRLQWKIDRIRALSSHPLGACVKITHLMWHSLAGVGGLRESFAWLGTESAAPMQTARVLRIDDHRRQA